MAERKGTVGRQPSAEGRQADAAQCGSATTAASPIQRWCRFLLPLLVPLLMGIGSEVVGGVNVALVTKADVHKV